MQRDDLGHDNTCGRVVDDYHGVHECDMPHLLEIMIEEEKQRVVYERELELAGGSRAKGRFLRQLRRFLRDTKAVDCSEDELKVLPRRSRPGRRMAETRAGVCFCW